MRLHLQERWPEYLLSVLLAGCVITLIVVLHWESIEIGRLEAAGCHVTDTWSEVILQTYYFDGKTPTILPMVVEHNRWSCPDGSSEVM